MDVFSYGLLLHYCLSGGRHPFGVRFERDMNILQVSKRRPAVRFPEGYSCMLVDDLKQCSESQDDHVYPQWSMCSQGRYNLDMLSQLPEAVNMIAAMLQLQSSRRPTMAAVMAHPAWWNPERKLAFLVEISNFVEFQDRQVYAVLQASSDCAFTFSIASWWRCHEQDVGMSIVHLVKH